MTQENSGPESGPMTGGADKARPNAEDSSSRQATRPVSKQSEAIIKEVSVRRRTAMKILASR